MFLTLINMFILQLLLNCLVIGTQVVLLAVPLYLVYSVSRIYHLGLGATAASLAYAIYFGIDHGWPLGYSILLAIGVAIIISYLSFYLLEPFAKKNNSFYGLLTSFAFGLGLEALLSIIFGTDGKFLFNQVLPIYSWGDLYLTQAGFLTIITGAILAIITVITLQMTPWGRILRSSAENINIATSLKINVSKLRLIVILIASLMAGFIGTMTSLNTVLTPQVGFNLIIMAFAALLIGGVSNLKGTIIAGYVLVLVPELLIGLSYSNYDLSANWKMVLVFLITTILLIWRPNGLLTKTQRQA